MYLWIPLPEGVPSALFAERLLEEEGVVVMPGSGFGAGGEGLFPHLVHYVAGADRRGGEAGGTRAGVDGGGGLMKASAVREATECSEARSRSRSSCTSSAIALIASITFRYPMSAFFERDTDRTPTERIQYVERPAAAARRASATARTRRRSRRRRSNPAPLLAPTTIPTALPPVPPPTVSAGAISGTGTGTGGAPARRRDGRRAGAAGSAHRASPEHAARSDVDGRAKRQRREGDLPDVSRSGARRRGESRQEPARLDDRAQRRQVRPRLAVHLPRQVQAAVGDSRRAAVQLRAASTATESSRGATRAGFRTTSTRTRRD